MNDSNSGGKYTIDMTHGPLFGKIIRFVLPLIATYLLQLLFNAADLIVIGHFASHEAMAAVGATTGFNVLLLNIFFGLSVGVNVLTARYKGARNRKNISRTVHTSTAVALYGGIIMGVIGILVSRPVLELMATPPAILPKASLYMWIYCAGVPFVVLYNFGSAVLRALGDTRRPLIFMVIAGILNVLLNLFFVRVFHWDVAGVATATLISNALSAVLVLGVLTRARDASRLFWNQLKLHGPIFLDMLKIGLPAGIQGSFFSISNLIIQSSINSFGAAAIAGNTAALSLESMVHVCTQAFYYTTISFVGQNHGAQKYKRIARSILLCLAVSTLMGVLAGWTVRLFGKPLLKIYTPSAEVIEWGLIRLNLMMLIYFLCNIMDVISGALRGLGHSIKPTVTTLLGVCVFRVAWVFWIFPLKPTLLNLLISYPVSWGLVIVVNGIILYWVCRGMFRAAAHPDGQLPGFGTLKNA
ncbi:MAG: MATE family efflux transporter [Lentisphaeria bacterium]|nr:MATE family efflux transporter [Lentisphaeria bacterium]